MDPDYSPEDFEHNQAEHPEHMTSALAQFLTARVELASIEAKEAASHASKKVAYGVALAISAFFVWSLLLSGVTGILAPIADQWLSDKADWLPGWAAIVLALAMIHGIVALVCFLKLRRPPATPLFELSRKEIENDKIWLKKDK
ncbi:MAG: phage holin family protein [Akkermansiaceae bacterium]